VLNEARLLRSVASIEDLCRLAHRRVPRDFMDYYESGSYAEETLKANREALSRIRFRQRVLAGANHRDLSTTILGEASALPLIVAPIGMMGMAYRDGEVLACRAAQAAGIPFTLSTMSICSIEDVAEGVSKPFWFQLYVMRDKGFIRALVDRAKAANCSALVLTVDLQVLGQRHRDVKNGLTVPPRLNAATALRIAARPAWAISVLSGKRKTFGNLAGHVAGAEGNITLAKWTQEQFDHALSWNDVAWIKSLWPGKLIIKGILDVDDARQAAKSGASAIVVSNHGGRQLDGAPAAITELGRIADAVGDDVEVYFDSGIRSGQDVMRALALGARACMIGRAPLFGLAAAGEAGVAKAFEIIRKELDVTMALTGVYGTSPALAATSLSINPPFRTCANSQRQVTGDLEFRGLSLRRRKARVPLAHA
jgi:L-lactate dehydrogenase (cytochrome)